MHIHHCEDHHKQLRQAFVGQVPSQVVQTGKKQTSTYHQHLCPKSQVTDEISYLQKGEFVLI